MRRFNWEVMGLWLAVLGFCGIFWYGLIHVILSITGR